jgi:hypothetical protein
MSKCTSSNVPDEINMNEIPSHIIHICFFTLTVCNYLNYCDQRNQCYKNPTKCVGLVQNWHHHLIKLKLVLSFSPWYIHVAEKFSLEIYNSTLLWPEKPVKNLWLNTSPVPGNARRQVGLLFWFLGKGYLDFFFIINDILCNIISFF